MSSLPVADRVDVARLLTADAKAIEPLAAQIGWDFKFPASTDAAHQVGSAMEEDNPVSVMSREWLASLVGEVDRAVLLNDELAPILTRQLAKITEKVSAGTFWANRLFAVAVTAAQGGAPASALPVAAVSALWWAGAEALDDIVDHATGGRTVRSSLAILPASIAYLALVPLRYLDSLSVNAELRSGWIRDVVESGLSAAEGQLLDAKARDSWTSRPAALACYLRKTSAAYARDALMATRLSGSTTAPATGPAALGWRTFAELFGVLRQLHNDNHIGSVSDDDDLANATPTLWMAHAAAVTPTDKHSWLRDLRWAAQTDIPARLELVEYLRSPSVLASYLADLRMLHAAACRCLEELAGPGRWRDVLRAAVDLATCKALPTGHPIERMQP